MTTIHHGTPMTPRAALEAMAGRAFCVSYYRPDDVETVERISPAIMYDNGAFSFWQQAKRKGAEFDEAARDWLPYYDWLETRLFQPGRWAVIPDAPGAPSQINDGLLNDWPHGDRGAPMWHMDGPLNRLARLCERYSRVCLGWVGNGPDEVAVGCDAYRRRMDEVAALFGNRWPVIHMMRGVAVARDYPFRQRRQHQFGAKRLEVRQPARRDDRRPVARTQSLCRQIGVAACGQAPASPRPCGENVGDDARYVWRKGMTPEAFADRCREIVETMTGDDAHRALDHLTNEVLAELGYGEGMAIFLSAVAPYHAASHWQECGQ